MKTLTCKSVSDRRIARRQTIMLVVCLTAQRSRPAVRSTLRPGGWPTACHHLPLSLAATSSITWRLTSNHRTTDGDTSTNVSCRQERTLACHSLVETRETKRLKNDVNEQESRANAGQPRDATAVRFDLKFADDMHYKFKSIARLQSSKHIAAKQNLTQMMIRRHSRSRVWSQLLQIWNGVAQ